MERKRITFYEYSGYLSDTGISEDLHHIGLSKETLSTLQYLSRSLAAPKQIFDFSIDTIKARSLVGTVCVEDIQVEILPKLLMKESDEARTNDMLRNLMFMLSYTHQIDAEDTGAAFLSRDFGSFVEAYIAIFADRLNRFLTRHGTPKRYEAQSSNLRCIRGKLNFARNSIENAFDQSKAYCEFSEFTEDNLISRALKFVSLGLEKQTVNFDSQRLLRRCIGLLEGVNVSFVDPGYLERASFGRRDPNFSALIQLTKLFLSRMQPQFGKASTRVFALLFDMNELFEQFIYEVLRRHADMLQVEVRAQTKKRLVTAERDLANGAEWSDRSLFDTYTDIQVRSLIDGSRMILDTKYKLVGDGAHYGVGNADAYQILAYKQIHSEDDDIPSVGLLYPKGKKQLWKEFRVNGNGPTFFAVTIDLSINLRENISALVEELGKVTAYRSGTLEREVSLLGRQRK